MRRLRNAPLSIILLVAGCADAQPDDALSAELRDLGFVESSVPRDAGWSIPPFFVEQFDGLAIREATPAEESTQRVDFSQGSVRYVGINSGEWGGGLYLDEWAENSEPLLEGNIEALIPIDGDLYVVEGLAHLSISEGSIHVIRDYLEPKEPEFLVELPDAPAVTHVEEGENGVARITIVGAHSLMEFSLDNRLNVIEEEAPWSGLYPTSTVKHGDHYIVGFRSGIAVVSTTGDGKRFRYFRPR